MLSPLFTKVIKVCFEEALKKLNRPLVEENHGTFVKEVIDEWKNNRETIKKSMEAEGLGHGKFDILTRRFKTMLQAAVKTYGINLNIGFLRKTKYSEVLAKKLAHEIGAE